MFNRPPSWLSGLHDDPYEDAVLLMQLGIPKCEASIIVGLCRDNGHHFSSVILAAQSGISAQELIVLAAQRANPFQDIFLIAAWIARIQPQIPDDLFGDE